MPSNWIEMAPGMSAVRTAHQRMIFLQRSESFLGGGRTIDGTKARDPDNPDGAYTLRPGLVMGKISASGKYANSVIGRSTGAYTSGGTTFTLSLAQAAELARRVGASGTGFVIGPPSAAGTVAKTALTFSAINLATGAVTITDLGVNKVAGSWLTADDGSEVPLTFIADFDSGYGVLVVDPSLVSLANVSFPLLPVSGVVNAPQLLPWPADTSLQTYLKTNLSTAMGAKYVFSDTF